MTLLPLLMALPFGRRFLWRAGRSAYMAARREPVNDPSANGEYWLLHQVIARAAAPVVLLDIGANRGNWTAHALSLARPHALRIHAFEPAADTRAMLAERLATAPAVAIHPVAVADRDGDAAFFSMGAGSPVSSLAAISGDRREQVPVVRVDTFMARHEPAGATMFKIDTEGFDFAVLRGAEATLASGRVEIVQFEYNWRWLINHACLRDVFEYLDDKPYRLGKLVPGGIEVYDAWHPELDRFFETNCVLIRRGSPLEALATPCRFDMTNTVVCDPVPDRTRRDTGAI
jgi:FkbM family methyltransferase